MQEVPILYSLPCRACVKWLPLSLCRHMQTIYMNVCVPLSVDLSAYANRCPHRPLPLVLLSPVLLTIVRVSSVISLISPHSVAPRRLAHICKSGLVFPSTLPMTATSLPMARPVPACCPRSTVDWKRQEAPNASTICWASLWVQASAVVW